MGSQFLIPISYNLFSESVGHCKLFLKNKRRGGRKHFFVNVCSLAVL